MAYLSSNLFLKNEITKSFFEIHFLIKFGSAWFRSHWYRFRIYLRLAVASTVVPGSNESNKHIHNKINIAVIGATGYTGLDLVLMLSKHPKVKIKYLCATKNLGKKISFFDKRIKKKLPKLSSVKKIKWEKLNLVFLSLPNGEAQKLIKKKFYENRNLKFIDLSADFRIKTFNTY